MQKQHRLKRSALRLGVLIILLMAACSPVRRLEDNQYLLTRNRILGNSTSISDQELLTYVKQKPNRKILGIWRFHLQTYSLVNKKRFEKRYAQKLEKRRLLNENRKLAGKKLKSEEPLSLAKWFLEIGEAPIVLDTLQLRRSASQVELYLKNHGYFDARVRDSVRLDSNRQMARCFYQISAGKPYRYGQIEYDISNRNIREIYMSNWGQSLLRQGDIYNVDLLDMERDRITQMLKNEGFYAFVKNYVTYSVDSSMGDRNLKLKLIISNPQRRVPGYVDSILVVDHTRYRIRDVYVSSDYTVKRDSSTKEDTLYFNHVHYITRNAMQFKPKTLEQALAIKFGDLYSKDKVDLTYRKFSEFNAFKFINLGFLPAGPDSLGYLDMNVRLSPRPRQAITYQTQGTNTAGNLGVALDVIYQNRNLFRGLELFELRLTGGLEVQRILGTAESQEESVAGFLPFNTLLFGPEASIVIPKIPKSLSFLGSSNRKTRIATFFNFQRRPDYERSIFTAIYGFSARSGKYVVWGLNPVEINFVNVFLSPSFASLLQSSNNLFLKNSFISQYISAGKLTRTYSNQILGSTKSFTFFQWNLETAGLILNGTRSFFQNPGKEGDQFVVFGVPYSQYLRFDTDFRRFINLSKNASVAFRGIVGLGIPYGNSISMPFEKSFFVGGANSIRAWIARSLGPGGYRDTSGFRIDQIGDIKLEWNVEFRQKLYSVFELAAFVDAGNVWLRQEDPLRPLAHFEVDRFYSEIAVGAGLGLRLNFNFFIIRLDAAHPLREPAFLPGDRWSFGRLGMDRVNFNFGIGYPF